MYSPDFIHQENFLFLIENNVIKVGKGNNCLCFAWRFFLSDVDEVKSIWGTPGNSQMASVAPISLLKEVKLPRAIISSLNWMLAVQPWDESPKNGRLLCSLCTMGMRGLVPSAAQGYEDKKTFEEEGISYRYDIMGKIWKSSIMALTRITPNNSQKPRDVTDRLQRVRPSGISTFVYPATSSLLPTLRRCMMKPQNAFAYPNPNICLCRLYYHPHYQALRTHSSGDMERLSELDEDTKPPDVAGSHKSG